MHLNGAVYRDVTQIERMKYVALTDCRIESFQTQGKMEL